MQFDEAFIKSVLSDVVILCGELPSEPLFNIDSRTIQPNEIFVALPGEQTDGHNFIEDVLKKNALGVMIASDKIACVQTIDQKLLRNKLVIVVKDTYAAFIKMATAWRERFAYPVIGITGSVGKTSTKEMVAAILNHAGKKYVASRASQNTHVGLAMNIFRMRADHEVAVFEMGISHRGEMALLARMVKPTMAVITNVGHAHMEGLGSLQDISTEKRAIFSYFNEQNIGIINGDLPVLSNVSYSHPVVRFGSKTTNQIQARKITIVNNTATFILKIYKKKYAVVLDKPHIGAVFAATAAAAVAHFLGIDHVRIVEAIQQPVVVKGRFEKRSLLNGAGVLINDCYNANPESMKAALLAFEQIETPAKKVVVLGDMLELGVNSAFWHRQIGRFLRKVPSVKQVLLVGSMVEWVRKTLPAGVEVQVVPSWKDATFYFEHLNEQSMVLIKGSNGVGLMNLVEKYSKSL